MANNWVKNFQFPKEGAWEGTLSLLCSWLCFGESAQIYIYTYANKFNQYDTDVFTCFQTNSDP